MRGCADQREDANNQPEKMSHSAPSTATMTKIPPWSISRLNDARDGTHG